MRPQASSPPGIDTAEHRAPAVSDTLHRLIWSPGWDRAMRGIGVCWTATVLTIQAYGLVGLLSDRPAGLTSAALVTAVASRVGILAFFAALLLFFLTRLKPVAKATGVTTRVVAVVGTFLPTLLVLLPRDEGSAAVNAVGATWMIGSNALSVYAFAYLNRSASIMPEARRLVTGGPYRIVRHPLYLFEELGVIGLALNALWVPRTAPLALGILVAHAWCQIRRVQIEERVLEAAFPEYSAYRARTPSRIIPNVY